MAETQPLEHEPDPSAIYFGRWNTAASRPKRTPEQEAGPDPFALYRQWWADVPKRRSPTTSRLYRYFVLRALADTAWDPVTIRAGELQRYLASFRVNHADLIRLALKDFLDFLVRRGLRPSNPLEDTKTMRRPGKRIKRGLTHDELIRLLITLTYLPPRFPWTGRRTALFALAQFLTGLRPGELLNLTTGRLHLDEPKPWIEIVGTKTGDDRLVPLSPTAQDVFRELAEGRNGRISDIGTRRYGELIHRAGVLADLPLEKQRPYALRHTFATTLIERGVHIRVVAELLGHRDLRHVWTYSTPADDMMRDAVGLL